MSRYRLVLAAALAAALQIGFLCWVIAGRAAILRSGQDVLLKVEPVDPRDFLRGDYVRLGYEIRDVPAALVVNPPAADAEPSRTILVRLARGDDGYWRARSATLGDTAVSPLKQGEVDVRGQILGGWPLDANASLTVDYGIDRFYVPDGEGKQIEKDLRVRPFGILAAVSANGTPQIKALMDGQTPLYEEPLY